MRVRQRAAQPAGRRLVRATLAGGAIKAAWMIGDIDAAQKHFSAEFESFEADGSLLSPLDFEGSKVAFAAGLKFNVQSAHSDVTVYGDTAILTEYHMRQLTPQVKPLSA